MSNKQQQRVNVQYSVNIEDVPKVLLKLATGAIQKLGTVATASSHNIEELTGFTYNNPAEAAKQIDMIRRSLADIDYRLAECQSMYEALSRLDDEPAYTTTAADQVEQYAQVNRSMSEMMAAEMGVTQEDTNE